MASKRDEKSLDKKENSLPAKGRSMTGGEEGASVAEVAATLPAHLLRAIEELRSSENLNEGEGRERDLFL